MIRGKGEISLGLNWRPIYLRTDCTSLRQTPLLDRRISKKKEESPFILYICTPVQFWQRWIKFNIQRWNLLQTWPLKVACKIHFWKIIPNDSEIHLTFVSFFIRLREIFESIMLTAEQPISYPYGQRTLNNCIQKSNRERRTATLQAKYSFVISGKDFFLEIPSSH